MQDILNYTKIKERFPLAFEKLELVGRAKKGDVNLKLRDNGTLQFIDIEGYISENYRWHERMLFDFFDEFQISVEIQPSFDSKIRFAHVVSYMNNSCDKIIFKSEGVWTHRETAEKEAFEAAFKCLNILLDKGYFKDLKLNKLID